MLKRGLLSFFILLSITLQAETASIEIKGHYSTDILLFETIQETDEHLSDQSSDIILFFGRFHPFLVHLPIGFLILAFLLEFAGLFQRFEQLQHAVPFALVTGLISAMAAAITGYMLSTGGGYGNELLSTHRSLAISVMSLTLLALLIRMTLYDNHVFKGIFRFLLVIMITLLIITGHYGGSLTHGSDYLFRYMPVTLQSMIGAGLGEEEEIALIEDLDSAPVYEKIIGPIIRTRCEHCHNPDRKEGELLLTSYDRLFEGGKNGDIILPNRSEESELYRRLLLPIRDEDRMPPRSRRQLTNDQIRLIGWWIDQGAPSSKMIYEMETAGEISEILQKLSVEGQGFFERTVVSKPDDETIEHAISQGFRVSRIAENLHFLEVRISKSENSITGNDLEILMPLREQISWLDLSRSQLSDNDLEILSEFHNLTRLSLQNNDISDRTLHFVTSLNNLEYLNLYSTGITDEGLDQLKKLTNLKTLYIWQTNVSREAAENLMDAIPGLHVNTGSGLSEILE